MTHGFVQVGRYEVIALCDAVFPSEESTEAAFPPVPEHVWTRMRAEHPETWQNDGMWQLHGHCFLVRNGDMAILFDTGIGPRSAPSFAWSGVEGRLPDDLAEVGMSPGDVDTVIISHVHDDHVGWNVAPDGAGPMFPNARYLLQRADWDCLHDHADALDAPEVLARTIEPLETAGQLSLLDGDMDVAPGLHLRHLPGHTPGHQVLLVDAGEGGDGHPIMISADVFNHPALFIDPSWWGVSDFDRDRACTVRAALLGSALEEHWIIATAHLEAPFDHVERDADGSTRFVAGPT